MMDEVGRSSAGAGANISPTPCFPERSGGSVVRPEEERPVAVGGGADEEGAPVSASFSWGMFTPQHGGGHQPPPQAYGEPHPPGHGNAQAPHSPWAHFHQGIQQDEPVGVGRLDAGDPFCPLPLDQQQQQQLARTMMSMGSINAPSTPIAPSPHGHGGPGSSGTITSNLRYGGSGGTNNNINFPPQSRSQDPQPPSGGYDATPSDESSEDTEETASSSSQSKDPLRGPKEKKKSRAPRRPLTAYKLFFREERSRIRSEERANKDDDENGEAGAEGDDRKARGDHRRGKGRSKSKSKARLADLSREIKRRWGLLTPEQKTYFEHMAREESQRYEGFYGEDYQGGRVASGSGAAVGTKIPGSKGDDSKRSPQGAADPFASASSHDPAAWDPPRSMRPQKLPDGHQPGNVGSHPQQGPLTSAPHYYPSPIRTDNTRSRMDGSSQSAPGHPPQGAFQQSRQVPHGQQHEQGQQYYHPPPEGGPPPHPHHHPPHMQYPSFPLVPQWIESSDGRSQPVLLPPPSCVVVHDADGVPRRYQLMYAAVSMPPDSASEYLMSVFSAARGMMGQMMTEENPHSPPPPPQPSGPHSAFFPGPPRPEGGPGDLRFSRGEYPHPHSPPPPGR